MRFHNIVVFSFCWMMCSAGAYAQQAFDFDTPSTLERGWKIYRKIPLALMQAAFQPNEHPDKHGFASHNALEGKWLQVGLQRGPLLPLLASALRADTVGVERDWPVIDVAFAHQRKDGSFPLGTSENPKSGETTSAAFFISQLSSAMLILEESPIRNNFSNKIEYVRKKVSISISNMSKPENVADMLKCDSATTNRLLMDAKGLILGGIFSRNSAGIKVGTQILDIAISKQAKNGVFPEMGGFDTSYQADSLLDLEEISIFYDYNSIKPALQRGMLWELHRINPDGSPIVQNNSRTGLGQEKWFGHLKGTNYSELIRSLAIYAALTDDTMVDNIALNVANYKKSLEHNAK